MPIHAARSYRSGKREKKSNLPKPIDLKMQLTSVDGGQYNRLYVLITSEVVDKSTYIKIYLSRHPHWPPWAPRIPR